jgi:hypothetical protein
MLNLQSQDILILGDSYAANRSDPQYWPCRLIQLLTGTDDTPRGQGFIGASWWSVRQRLLRELALGVPQVLIITHTEPNRLPSDYDFPLNICAADAHRGQVFCSDHNQYPGVSTRRGYFTGSTLLACEMYYKHLHSELYPKWAQQQWFQELDSLLQSHHIPIVIHLHCFNFWQPSTGIYTFKHGITSDEILFELSERDNLIHNLPRDRCPNHFSAAGNLRLAAALHAAVVNYDTNSNGTLQHLDLYQQHKEHG